MSVQLKEIFYVLVLISAAAIFGADSARADEKKLPECSVTMGYWGFHVEVGEDQVATVGGTRSNAERYAARLALSGKCKFGNLPAEGIPECKVYESKLNYYVSVNGTDVEVFGMKKILQESKAVEYGNRLVVDGKCTKSKTQWGAGPPPFGISEPESKEANSRSQSPEDVE